MGAQYIRVNSPLGMYVVPHGPICITEVGPVPSVSSTAPQVEAPSNHCSSSLHSFVLVGH